MAEHFVILSQVPKTRSQGNGLFQNVMQVTFKTLPSEQTGTVDIPTQNYTADEVARIVEPLAVNIETIQKL